MTTTTDTFEVTLVNGATVEIFHWDFVLNRGTVLARWREEWVTWSIFRSNREPGKFEAETGHYFRDAEKHHPHPSSKAAAYEDFKKRATYAT